jgi:hypothetical protein
LRALSIEKSAIGMEKEKATTCYLEGITLTEVRRMFRPDNIFLKRENVCSRSAKCAQMVPYALSMVRIVTTDLRRG